MIKRYKQFNEELFGIFKSKKDLVDKNLFEFKLHKNYKPSKFEDKMYSKLGNTFKDCLQDFLDDNSGEFAIGFRSLKYPVITMGVRFGDFYGLTESVNLAHGMNRYIDMAISMMDVDIIRIIPHISSSTDFVTYKIESQFDKGRFALRDNFLFIEEIHHIDNVDFSRTSIFFSILNPYYSEFNYGN